MIRFNIAETEQPIRGELRVLRKLNDLEYEVELDMLRSGRNLNGWDYRNIDKYAETFAGTPILTAYLPNGKVGDGHNYSEVFDPKTGEKYISFEGATAERIVGMISDKKGDIWTEEKDGQTWIKGRGKLWTFYNKRLCDKIAVQGSMSVSVETEVTESHTEGDTEIFTVWRGLGTTILGNDVQPAVPSANIRAAAFKAVNSEFEKIKLKAASLENAEKNKAKPYSVIFKKKE